jgi:hypothetical protein
MAPPGCPDLALSTIAAESTLMLLAARIPVSFLVICNFGFETATAAKNIYLLGCLRGDGKKCIHNELTISDDQRNFVGDGLEKVLADYTDYAPIINAGFYLWLNLRMTPRSSARNMALL